VKKRRLIESERQLLDIVGKPAETIHCSDQVHSCIGTSHRLVPTYGCFVISLGNETFLVKCFDVLDGPLEGVRTSLNQLQKSRQMKQTPEVLMVVVIRIVVVIVVVVVRQQQQQSLARRPRRAGGQPCTLGQSVVSWPEASPINFGLSENLLLVRNFSSKNANFEAEKLLFCGNLESKLKF